MWRILALILLSSLPLAPASAVVSIEMPVHGVPQASMTPQEPAVTALSFGEMAAILGGLMIFAVALGSRRRTVTA